MESLNMLWKSWKNPYVRTESSQASMLNDDNVTIGKVPQSARSIKQYHSFQIPNGSLLFSSMVGAQQTSTIGSKEFTNGNVEDIPQQAQGGPRSSFDISKVETTQHLHRQTSANGPIPSDGVATCRLLLNLLKSGSKKLNFTAQAMELVKEYVWMLQMFPNHIYVGEELEYSRLMAPPPQPRINVFAQPGLLARIKTDVHGNWLIDSDALSCMLYFLYHQQCKPMLEEMNQERKQFERMRNARREHVCSTSRL